MMVLTFSFIWLLLAAAVTLAAVLRRPAPISAVERDVRANLSGEALTLLAAIYGVALLAGFIYVSKFLVSSL
jgi:hypothetical protein